MCFIDHENPVFRYQDMCTAGRKPNSHSVVHMPDVFVWRPHIRGEESTVVRVDYYTSAVGSDEKTGQIHAVSNFPLSRGCFGSSLFSIE
jgi:hypothetical protein